MFGEAEAASIFPELGPVQLDDQDTLRSCIATASLPASSTLGPLKSSSKCLHCYFRNSAYSGLLHIYTQLCCLAQCCVHYLTSAALWHGNVHCPEFFCISVQSLLASLRSECDYSSETSPLCSFHSPSPVLLSSIILLTQDYLKGSM